MKNASGFAQEGQNISLKRKEAWKDTATKKNEATEQKQKDSEESKNYLHSITLMNKRK